MNITGYDVVYNERVYHCAVESLKRRWKSSQ